MVNKRSKFGVRSGNSLQASNSKHAQLYGKQSFFVRQSEFEFVPLSSGDQALSDWDVKTNDVCYSLNKKGRWKLPEVIKTQIHSDEQAEEEFRLSLFECHKSIKRRDCVSYHTSKGLRTTIQAKKGYFDNRSVNENPSERHRNRRRRRQTRGDNPDPAEPAEPAHPPQPHVSYRVFYPSPKTSSVTHNFKFIGKPDEHAGDGKANPAANRRANLTTSQYLHIYDEETRCDEWSDDESESEIEGPSTPYELEAPSIPYGLDTLLDRVIKAKELCDVEGDFVIPSALTPTKKSRTCPCRPFGENGKTETDTKSHVVYVDEDFPAEFRGQLKAKTSKKLYLNSKVNINPTKDEILTEVNTGSTVNPLIKTMPSARVVIADKELTLQNLNHLFPGRCYEGRGHPRRLVVNITEDVTSVFRQRRLITSKQEAWSWLVLTQDGTHGEGLQAIRVHVNSELCFTQTRLETLFEMDLYSLAEVYGSIQMFLESCSSDSFQNVDSVMCATTLKPMLTLDTLTSLNGWGHEGYHGSQSHKTTMLIPPEIGRKKTPCNHEEQLSSESLPEFCNICFAPIDPSLLENDPATSLASCDHWFCDACWREHLLHTIDQGFLRLTCPYDCDSRVDHVTALSLIPASKYKKFLQHCHDNNVQQETDRMKWCPNPKCGRVLTATRTDSAAENCGMCVMCDCGFTFCFQCLGEAHWPASCQQARDYRSKMRSLGDEKASFISRDTDFVVKVKLCQKCREPINKNGGCPHMVCRCGCQFCWTCGQAYTSHYGCSRAEVSDDVGTVERVLRHDDRLRNRPKFYLMALKNRELRCPKMLRRLEKNEKTMISSFQRWSVCHFAEVERILGGYGAVEGDSSSIYQAVQAFIHAMSRLTAEIHFIIEHTAVLLQSKGAKCQSKLICHLIGRLDFISLRIKQIFEDGCSGNSKNILTRLHRLQREVRRCLVVIIPVLAACDTQ